MHPRRLMPLGSLAVLTAVSMMMMTVFCNVTNDRSLSAFCGVCCLHPQDRIWSQNFLLNIENVSDPRRSRDSVVGIATSYGLDDRGVGVRVPVGSRIFSSPNCPIQWVPGALSSGVKRPGREVDHSPPTSAEVKKMWIYTSTPSYAFMT
jgi:hypothetical protein